MYYLQLLQLGTHEHCAQVILRDIVPGNVIFFPECPNTGRLNDPLFLRIKKHKYEFN